MLSNTTIDIPKEIIILVQNLVQVTICKTSGNLQAQEELEQKQIEIWKEEQRINAIKAEATRIERAKLYERLHSPSKEETKTKDYLLARIEDTTRGNKRRNKKQSSPLPKQVKKIHSFLLPIKDDTFLTNTHGKAKSPNNKTSYQKLLEFYTSRNSNQSLAHSTNIFEEVYLQEGAEEEQQQQQQRYNHNHGNNRNAFYHIKKNKVSIETKQNPFVRFQHSSSAPSIFDKLTSHHREPIIIPSEEERDMHSSEKHKLTDWEKMLTASSYQGITVNNSNNNWNSRNDKTKSTNDTAINTYSKTTPQINSNTNTNLNCLNNYRHKNNSIAPPSSNTIIQDILFPQVYRGIQRCGECSIVLPFRSGAYLKHQQNTNDKDVLCDRCRFAFLANKRQKEVRAHVYQRRARNFSSNGRDRKQMGLLKRQIYHEKQIQLERELQQTQLGTKNKNKSYARYIEHPSTATSVSSTSSESDNDSAKEDLLSSFNNNRTFDCQLLHSVSMSIAPSRKTKSRIATKLNDTQPNSKVETKIKKKQTLRNIRKTSLKSNQKKTKSKSIADSIESKKKQIINLNPIKKNKKKIVKGKDLRNELKQMKKDSKMERELCKKMRLQRGGKNITPLTRDTDRCNKRFQPRSATAMAKLGEEPDEIKREREIKRRLISIASLQLDTVQYEHKCKYRRKK